MKHTGFPHSSFRLWRSALAGWGLALAVGAPGVGFAQTGPAPTATPAPSAAGAPMSLPTAPPSSVPAATAQSASDLRTVLDTLLTEHTYLAGQTTGALLGGRMDEAQAAAMTLDVNAQEIAGLIGSIYGQPAQQQFLSLWRRHLADYAQYAQATPQADVTSRSRAREDLVSFAQDLDAFISSANPNVPAGSLVDGLTKHVEGTLDVIDAQSARDYPRAFTLAKQGADMTAMLGDPLAVAIAQQFPEEFPTASTPDDVRD
jgi:hypothetical protein